MGLSKKELNKRYEDKHKKERKERSIIWETSIPRKEGEEINAFLKKYGIKKVELIKEGYKKLKEQIGELDTESVDEKNEVGNCVESKSAN